MQLSGDDAKAMQAGRYDWINIQKELRAHGIETPRLLAEIRAHAALVIEDYGDVMLETVAQKALLAGDFHSAADLYHSAIADVFRMGSLTGKDSVWRTRAFDYERLTWELNFFRKKYLQAVLNIDFSGHEEAAFVADCEALAKYISDLPQVFVHRDFHSRNIMVRNGRLAVIDFQDARLGPAAYDLVSLVYDSYVPFAPEQREQLMNYALKLSEKMFAHSRQVAQSVQEGWKPVLLQRQIKAIGSFGYLTVDRQRGDYLKYVVPALSTLLDAGVADTRWQFLSTDLLRKIQEKTRV
jgi:aminoglycoside/choline kinase family phosphotransferase